MINKALKVIRQFHEMKQVELANKLAISKSYLSEIESGKKPASLELLNKYSEVYDIPVSSLIFFSENMGREGLSSSKFKKAVASKIVNVMEWFVKKMPKKLKLKVDNNRRKHKLFESSLYKLKTKRKLANLLRVTIPELKIATTDTGNYVVFEQEGKSGKTRTIQHPKDSQKAIHCRIASLLCRIEIPEYLHSGRKKHSHITNARAHTGNKKVLTTDIKSFFSSTTRKMVFNFFYNTMKCSPDVADLLASICTYNGHIPTGSQLSMPLAFWAKLECLNS